MAINIIVSSRTNIGRIQGYSNYPSRIAYGIAKRGHNVNIIPGNDLINYMSGQKFLNISPGDVLHFRSTLNHELINRAEEKGFICVNPGESIHNASDKLHSQLLASKNGIAIAPTYDQLLLRTDENFLKKLADIMDQNSWESCIIKPNFASGNGANVWKVDRSEVLDFDQRRINRVEHWIVQKCIKYDRILRTIIHGGELVPECVTYDRPTPGGWKCTVCINPHMMYEPNPSYELKTFAEKICEVIGANRPGIAYIDVFETQDGYVYGETNVGCTLEQHEQVTGFPVYQHKADYLISLLK